MLLSNALWFNPSAPATPAQAWIMTGSTGPYGGPAAIINTTEVYNFVDDSKTTGTAITLPVYDGFAAGNTSVAIVAGGLTANTGLSSTNRTSRIVYSTNTSASGANINDGVYSYVNSAASTSTQASAYFFAGNAYNSGNTATNSVSRLYQITFATSVSSATTGLASVTSAPGAINNSTQALIGGGSIGGSVTQVTTLYGYTGGSYSSGTSLVNPGRLTLGAAFGNSTQGYFAGGQGSGSTGATAYVDNYVYSTTAMTASTALATPRMFQASPSSTTTGYLFGGGTGSNSASPSNITSKFDIASTTVTAGTNLTTARMQHVATSTRPGGIS